ncbi:restriction endonuclease subunit S [Kingella negevensis]|uniref:restriction endonuclease subunit S n=1 Tax=Kingella negevensis TaxID=1522312 RepID=UPI00254F4A32|nr:restriction endonuclease subunit S [Kingella negevensis]MDK4709963.1 restriction endonuclease subunit S [Kingella negevensis]
MRKKQYTYYRDLLLDYEHPKNPFSGCNVQWKTLAKVAIIGTGSRNTNEAIEDGEFPFYVRSQEPKRIDEYEFDETAIITAGDGVGVGKVFHFASGKYALHQRAYRIVMNNAQVIPKYAFHYIRMEFPIYLEKNSVSSSVTSLRKPMFEKFQIPIPPLETQAKIVEILDKFDMLVHSISEGLPREIELRQKQYEYYREKLLDFPRE